MRHAHEGGRIADLTEQRPSRFSRLLGVVVRHHAQFGESGLQRRMDHVAGDDGVRAGPADPDRIVIDGVAGRRDERDEIVERVRALDDVGPVGGYDREHGIDDPGTRCPGRPAGAWSSRPAPGRRTHSAPSER
jgi:hypothetical protein